ncbi:MAG: DNA translocase FtsK [Planctomycetota bacterium]
MSRNDSKETEPAPKKRMHRYVPVDDVPAPGLSQRAREVVALALCGFALYGMLCLSTFRLATLDGDIPFGDGQNLGGAFGYHLAHGFAASLGLAGWAPFAMLLLAAVCLFLGRSMPRPTIKALGTVVFAAMLAILFAGGDGTAGVTATTPYGAGGRFGSVVSPKLESAFGSTGRILLVAFGAVMALMIATEWLFSQLVARCAGAVEAVWRRVLRRPAPAAPGLGGVALEGAIAESPSSRPRKRRSEDDADERQPVATTEPKSADCEPAGGDPSAPDGEPATEPRRRRRSRTVEDAAEIEAANGTAIPAPDEPVVEIPRPEPTVVPTDPAPASAAATGTPAATPAVTEPPPPPPVVIRPKPKPKPKPKKKPAGQSTLPFEDYPFPPIELFQEPVLNDATTTTEALAKGGQAIVNKLANFDIQAEVVEAAVGPAVTQYELRLHESIRVNRVSSFESDLAAALKAVSVRVVAPIPGKDTIGVEVPNAERQKVFMRDLLDQFGRSEDLAIPLYLGKDVAGTPIVEDLARMPHLLIAGTTGSGKSVCINTILLSILMTRTPSQVKLILVDPKMVELQAYKRVPHLCCDVVTNMKKAPGVLQWAVDEMENRYALFSGAGVNHIRSYNRLGQQELAKRIQREPDPDRVYLPYVVIVIDEFADLMNVAQNEIEELIQRLAQKSRAVGMHVILATQRPSSEVITGIIKANLPTQIAFKVNRKIDSRVILDVNGAEKLLGYGDMLYMPPGGGALMRAQGTFVADDELQSVVRWLEDHGQEPEFMPALMQTQSSSRPAIADRDDRYREAVEIILGQQRGSATLLQRALAVGYTRATRLLELMEEDGLVGAFVGSKSRDVLLTLEEWRTREAEAEAQAESAEAADGAEGDGDDAGAVGDAPADDVAASTSGTAVNVDGEGASGEESPDNAGASLGELREGQPE